MDSERFDRLVRTFGQTRTRRQALRGLAGAAAAATLGLGGQEARADVTCAADGSWCRLVKRKRKRKVRAQDDTCKSDGQACKKNSQCCSSNCVGGTGSGSTSKSEGVCQSVQTCTPLGAACAFPDPGASVVSLLRRKHSALPAGGGSLLLQHHLTGRRRPSPDTDTRGPSRRLVSRKRPSSRYGARRGARRQAPRPHPRPASFARRARPKDHGGRLLG